MLFGSAPNRIIIAYEQQRVWREVWMDGRALPNAVDVRGSPESRYYGYSIGRWENDNTLVIDTTGVDERPWLDEVGHPRSSSARIQERYTRRDEYNLELTVTVDDPKFCTKPWTWMRTNFYWMKAQEFVETFCIPSEAIEYPRHARGAVRYRNHSLAPAGNCPRHRRTGSRSVLSARTVQSARRSE